MAQAPATARSDDLVSTIERALSAAVSRLLALDEGADARLARLRGRAIAFALRGRNLRVFALVEDNGLLLSRELERDPDVVMTGKLNDFVALVRANQRGDSIAAGRIDISGDLAVAQEVQGLLNELDIDIEELLSRYLGDVAAYRLTRLSRGAAQVTRESYARLESDIVDYLRHELNALPTRAEVEAQQRAIFALSDDVERAAERLRRVLESRRSP